MTVDRHPVRILCLLEDVCGSLQDTNVIIVVILLHGKLEDEVPFLLQLSLLAPSTSRQEASHKRLNPHDSLDAGFDLIVLRNISPQRIDTNVTSPVLLSFLADMPMDNLGDFIALDLVLCN